MEHTSILPQGASLDAGGPLLPSGMGIEPLSTVARALAGFNREQLGNTIELLIDLLDVTDGDPDLEPDDRAGETIGVMGDPDLEQTMCEDDWYAHVANGPGCPISDPGGAGEDEETEPDGTEQGDVSWTEWHTRGRHKADFGVRDRHGVNMVMEDAEEDDPVESEPDDEEDDDPGQCTEDEISSYLIVAHGRGPGCTISDAGDYDDGV